MKRKLQFRVGKVRIRSLGPEWSFPGMPCGPKIEPGEGNVYCGVRDKLGVRVYKNGAELPATRSQIVWNHSPDGFNWGYGGSGPAQLALAILLEEYEDVQVALRFYQAFKRYWVAALEEDTWTIRGPDIRCFITAIELSAELPEVDEGAAGG